MKHTIIALLLVSLFGCASKVAPVNLKWPDAPPELMAPSEDLVPLDPNQTKLSDLIDNANTNFSKYYILKDRYDAWQNWYNTHRQIYQGAQ
jgi:hypothetical protein